MPHFLRLPAVKWKIVTTLRLLPIVVETLAVKGGKNNDRKTNNMVTLYSSGVKIIVNIIYKPLLGSCKSHSPTRWLKESIWVCSQGEGLMNKDEGAYKLNRIYDQLIKKMATQFHQG